VAVGCAAAAVVVAVAVASVPIRGTDINQSGVSVECGSAFRAFGAFSHLEPPPPGSRGSFIASEPGSDVGYGPRAWCQGEAARWIVPATLLVVALLAVAVILTVSTGVAAHLRRRSLIPA
jgi:hypothetical protein